MFYIFVSHFSSEKLPRIILTLKNIDIFIMLCYNSYITKMRKVKEKNMKKTVKSEIFEKGEYKIEIKKELLTISASKKVPVMEIQKIEVKGEIKDLERALEIAEKNILDLEQGAGDYCDIAKPFKEVKEYTMDLDSGYGDVDVFLGELAQQAYNSFYEKVRTKVSADGGKSYLVLHEGNVECRIDDGLVRIEGERFALESGEYGLSAALSQISEVTDFLSEKSLETYEMLLEKFD